MGKFWKNDNCLYIGECAKNPMACNVYGTILPRSYLCRKSAFRPIYDLEPNQLS